MEFAMQKCLGRQDEADPRLLAHLLKLHELPEDCPEIEESLRSAADRVIRDFNLNEDQGEALKSTARWLQDEPDEVQLLFFASLAQA